jgi:hypothetical protein
MVSDALIAQLDASLAARIGAWECWSRRRIIHAVDAAVRGIDPDAAKQRRVRADDDRHLSITALPDGMTQVRGSLPATAGAALTSGSRRWPPRCAPTIPAPLVSAARMR